MCYSDFFVRLPWWTSIVVVSIALLVIHFAAKFLYKCLYPKCVAKGNRFSALVIQMLYQPFQAFMWFSALIILVSLYAHYFFAIGVITWITNLLRIGAIFSGIWAAHIFASGVKEFIAEKRHFDLTTKNFISMIIFILTGIVALLLILPILGFQIGGLLAFGGMSGIIAGFAAREAIANLFGGFLIALDRPFKIGDWIHSLDHSIEGYVEHVGWRLTRIRTFEKRPLYVPNSLFSSMSFVNGSNMTNRRIMSKFAIRYQDKPVLKMLILALNAYILGSDLIDQNHINVVNFDEFGENGLEIFVRIYTKATGFAEFHLAKEKIFLDFFEIIEKHGADFANPTSNIRIINENQGKSKIL